MSDEIYIAEAILGQDAQDFVRTNIGRFVIGKADQEIEQALSQLENVSPWRRNKIRELQNMIWRARSVKGWIAELIINGKQAERKIDEQGIE